MGNEEVTSRRAKLLGFARATRDTYIPKIAGTVAGSVSSFVGQGSDPLGQSNAWGHVPDDAAISLYPTYTRKTHKDSIFTYHVDVNGWLSCPGLMTRKNRLILSLARQLTRSSTTAAAAAQSLAAQQSPSSPSSALSPTTSHDQDAAALSELKQQKQDIYDDSDTESIVSSVSSSSSSVPGQGSDTLKERLSGFIARSIPNVELEITIGSEDDDVTGADLTTHKIRTDANGNFKMCLECTYRPSTVRVHAVENDTIFEFQDVMLIEDEGVGLISDIDDTVKLTGVLGDKRELMRSLLLSDVSKWSIQSVVSWYTTMYADPFFKGNLSFHYISNSPWQLFPTISSYFKFADLPPGSVHLKQYTGNIIASLMEPATSKKKTALYKVIGDFPNKKFVCVGDSGEYDFEAYTDAARQFPSHIMAIYIRVVAGSLSDRADDKILKQIQKLLQQNAARESEHRDLERAISLSEGFSPVSSNLENTTSVAAPAAAPAAPPAASTENLIDLDSKPGPMVPKKPDNLRSNKVERKPPLPERRYLSPVPRDMHTPSPPPPQLPPIRTPPKRSTTVTSSFNESAISSPTSPTYNEHNIDLVVSLMQEVYPHADTIYELQEIDKRGTAWMTRVVEASEALVGTNTEIRFFTDADKDLVSHSIGLIKVELRDEGYT